MNSETYTPNLLTFVMNIFTYDNISYAFSISTYVINCNNLPFHNKKTNNYIAEL